MSTNTEYRNYIEKNIREYITILKEELECMSKKDSEYITLTNDLAICHKQLDCSHPHLEIKQNSKTSKYRIAICPICDLNLWIYL